MPRTAAARDRPASGPRGVQGGRSGRTCSTTAEDRPSAGRSGRPQIPAQDRWGRNGPCTGLLAAVRCRLDVATMRLRARCPGSGGHRVPRGCRRRSRRVGPTVRYPGAQRRRRPLRPAHPRARTASGSSRTATPCSSTRRGGRRCGRWPRSAVPREDPDAATIGRIRERVAPAATRRLPDRLTDATLGDVTSTASLTSSSPSAAPSSATSSTSPARVAPGPTTMASRRTWACTVRTTCPRSGSPAR